MSLVRILIFILPLITLGENAAFAQSGHHIVAQVNKNPITISDLNARVRFVIFSSRLNPTQQNIRRISSQVLRSLIDENLQLQETKRLGIRISQSALDQAIRRIGINNKVPSGDMKKLLVDNRINYRTFEKQVEVQLAWQQAVVRKVKSSTKVGDDAIDNAIVEIEKNKGKPEYFIAEIFIPFDPTKSPEETLQVAQRLHSQLAKGANFNALARSFSQNASAAKGGNLGWIRRDQVDENLSEIITQMTKGSTTNPVQGADGYYILRLLNKRISSGIPSGNISVSLQQVFLPLSKNATPTEISAQKSKGDQITLAAQSCSALEKVGTELGSPQSGRLEVTNLSRLPENIRNVVQNIPLSKASEPVRTGAGFLVLMVCSRSGGGVTEEVRNRIRNSLYEQQAALISRRMLRDLRRSAFVDIRR